MNISKKGKIDMQISSSSLMPFVQNLDYNYKTNYAGFTHLTGLQKDTVSFTSKT